MVDDHADSRDALRYLLEALGYAVHVAGNGAEAVACARRVVPDLILMDVMMPGVDGLTATRLIRADGALPRMPIVAVTACGSSPDELIRAGCTDVVTKPVDMRGFMARLNAWLRPPEMQVL